MTTLKFKVDFPSYQSSLFGATQSTSFVLNGIKRAIECGGEVDGPSVKNFMENNRGQTGSIEVNVEIDFWNDDEEKEIMDEIVASLPTSHTLIFKTINENEKL